MLVPKLGESTIPRLDLRNTDTRSKVSVIKKWGILDKIRLETTTQGDGLEDVPAACGFDAEYPRGVDTENYLHGVELLVEDVYFVSPDYDKENERIHTSLQDEDRIHTTTSYHNRLFCHRPRTHIFSILVDGRSACFARWSRAGLRRSKTFDYVCNPQIFANFLQRLEYIPEARFPRRVIEVVWGRDYTATPATVQEQELLEQGLEAMITKLRNEGRRVPANLEEVCDPRYEPYSITCTRSSKDVGRLFADYIVWKPMVEPTTFISDGTRRYIAWAVTEKKLVVLTDAWRNPHEAWELDTNHYLTRIHKIRDLPSVLFADAVGFLRECITEDKKTVRKFFPRTDDKRDPRSTETEWGQHLTHYRVVQEYTLPLTSVATELELMQALYDALSGKPTFVSELGRELTDSQVAAAKDVYKQANAVSTHTDIQLDLHGRGILGGWENISWDTTLRGEVMTSTCFWQFLYAATSCFKYVCHEDAADKLAFLREYWLGAEEPTLVLFSRRRWTLEMIKRRELRFTCQPLDALVLKLAGKLHQMYEFRSIAGEEEWRPVKDDTYKRRFAGTIFDWGSPSDFLEMCSEEIARLRKTPAVVNNANHPRLSATPVGTTLRPAQQQQSKKRRSPDEEEDPHRPAKQVRTTAYVDAKEESSCSLTQRGQRPLAVARG